MISKLVTQYIDVGFFKQTLKRKDKNKSFVVHSFLCSRGTIW